MTNWTSIARRDAELRASVENASEALARLRYENTIAVGVTFHEYALKCGLTMEAVRRYARAWQVMTSSASPRSLSDALVRVETSAERADVIEAIAEVRGVTPKAIHAHHKDEVRRIESIARERAAEPERETTVRDEASKLAQIMVRREASEREQRSMRNAKKDLRFIELERHLMGARRCLTNAIAVDAELDDEHRELLAHAVTVVRDLLNLVDLKFVGAADIDWDAELARLGEA